MGLFKRVIRSQAVQESLGLLVAGYLKLVQRTNRFVVEPADAYDRIGPQMPVIAAMWHGQHFMIHFAKRPQDRAASLVSRSADGEFNAIALRHLGIRAIRGVGIVTLAQMSGRPIVPVAVVTSRRIDFNSWDRASIGLPFGRGAIVLGEPVHVPRDADAAALEGHRLTVERELDRIHERAYALVGSKDPGAKDPSSPALAGGSQA